MADISRDELDRLYHTLDSGFQGVHSRLDMLNSRTSKAEQEIAVLKDRSQGHGLGMAIGGGVSAAILGGAEMLRWWFSK